MRMSGFLWLYLAGALLIPGRPLYTVLYFAGGVFLLARFSLSYAIRRMTVERELSDQKIFLGESVTVTLRLKNPTGMPLPWVQFIESRPPQMASEPFCKVVALGPGETVTASYSLHGNKRGRYDVGPISFSAGDPFGFTGHEEKLFDTLRFTVYPKVSPLPDLGLPARLPMGDLATRRRLFEDPAWLTGTRPYVAGDSMKRIHWNATARTGELMVKQFRHAMLLPSCVLLNLNREEYGSREFWTGSELGIQAAASLCHHLVEQKQQVGLVVTGIDPDAGTAGDEAEAGPGSEAHAAGDQPGVVTLPLRQGRGAVAEVLELLARVEAVPEARIPFARTVIEQAQRLPYGTLLCIVTPRETDEIAAACTRIARSGQQVLLFLTDGGLSAGGSRPGYRVFPIEDRRGEVALG